MARKENEWLEPEEMVGFANEWLKAHGLPECAEVTRDRFKLDAVEMFFISARIPASDVFLMKGKSEIARGVEDVEYYAFRCENAGEVWFRFWFRKGERTPRWMKRREKSHDDTGVEKRLGRDYV